MGRILDRLKQERPALAVGIELAIELVKARRTNLARRADPLTEDEEKEVAAIATNNAGEERKPESRVVTGSGGSLILSVMTFIGGLIGLIQLVDWDQPKGPAFWMAVSMTLFGGGAAGGNVQALVGRLRDDLPPMSFRWWNPFSWLARREAEVLADPAPPG